MNFDFYITGTIGVVFDWWTGQRGTTAAQVRHFLDENKDKEVNIAVSSPGGYLSEGIEICELIKAHGKCNMVIVGMTASAATILCMKAKSVRIAKGSMMLIHNSSYSLDVWTTANKKGIDQIIENFKKYRDDLDTFDKAIADIYSSRNGKTMEENMSKMDEEKWMMAQDAVDFGIADSVLEEEDIATNAKAIKNCYQAQNGLSEHFGLPEIPSDEKPEPKHRPGLLERIRLAFNKAIDNEVNDESTNSSTNDTQSTMKKIILNLICAVIAVQEIILNEKGEAALTEEQLQNIENDLKAKADRITALEAEKKKAEDDKKTAEQALADLQKQFDEFKKKAGDDTSHVHNEEKVEDVSAKDMYNDVKNMI